MRTESLLTETTSLYSIFNLSSLKKIVTIATSGPSLVTGSREYFSNMIISKNKKLFLGATVSGNVRAFNEKDEDIIKQLSFGAVRADLATVSLPRQSYIQEFTADSKFTLFGSFAGEVSIVNNQTGEVKVIQTSKGVASAAIDALYMLDNGKQALTVSSDGEINIINIAAATSVTAKANVGRVFNSNSVSFDMETKTLVVSGDKSIQVFQLK